MAGLLAVAGRPVDVRAEIFNFEGNLFVGGTSTLSTGTTGGALFVGPGNPQGGGYPSLDNGNLNVVAGGSVTTSGGSYIGGYTGFIGGDPTTGVGTVTVSSGGSINTGLIGIGWNGNGTLNVNGGLCSVPICLYWERIR